MVLKKMIDIIRKNSSAKMARMNNLAHWNSYSTNLRNTKNRGKTQTNLSIYESLERACYKKRIDTKSTAIHTAENRKIVLSSLS